MQGKKNQKHKGEIMKLVLLSVFKIIKKVKQTDLLLYFTVENKMFTYTE